MGKPERSMDAARSTDLKTAGPPAATAGIAATAPAIAPSSIGWHDQRGDLSGRGARGNDGFGAVTA